MIFQELEIAGVYLITPVKNEDERGFFARTFCEREFREIGLCTSFVQCNLSYNTKKGTLRGMHYQAAPYEEVKIVSCPKGAVYDVALDIRSNSPTFGKWISRELNEDNHEMLYLPKGIAHGFQTLEDDTLVYYQIGAYYEPKAARGIRYDDPRYAIQWPFEEKILSNRDKEHPVGVSV